MKKTVLLAACVLFILVIIFQRLICSSHSDKQLRWEVPGSWSVIDSANEIDSEDNWLEAELLGSSSDTVMICKSKKSYAYHNRVCKGLKRCKAETRTKSKRQAQEEGYRACKYCY